LWLPGWPADRGAGVWLRPDGLVLAARGATACLAWEDHDDGQWRPGRSRPNGWWVTWYTSGRGGVIGVAIGVKGEAAAATAAVRAATNTWLSRFHRLVEDGTAVALRLDWRISRSVDAERDTLSALCRLLAERPPVRSRLADRHRVGMLIEAMATGAVRGRPDALGVRRSTMEVLAAMRSLGHRHRVGGRPLPGDPLPSVEMVVDQVLDHVARNPYAQGVSLERAAVAKLVNRHYLGIEPWPFAALTEAVPVPG
jgi:hypothetical protein